MGCWRTFLLRMAEAKDDLRTFLKVDVLKDFKTDMTIVLGRFSCTRCDVMTGDGWRVQGGPRLLQPLTCSRMASTTGDGWSTLGKAVPGVVMR